MGEKKLSQKAREALRHIRNTIMHSGKVPSVRELMLLLDYKSPRSAVLVMEELETEGFLIKKESGTYQLIKDLENDHNARTVSIPLVGSVPCGTPILAQENIEAFLPISITLARPGAKYFLLRANGDSMNNAGIEHGDLILVRQQFFADNGDKVVALIDDEATVKEFRQTGAYVALLPRSINPVHQPIILTRDFQIQGVVVATIPKL